MAEPTLQFLGEQIARIQAELRELRGVRADVAHLRADIADTRTELANRMDVFEAGLASVNAQIAQVRETMTTNLEVVLAAINGPSS